jgi:hypothetical protein
MRGKFPPTINLDEADPECDRLRAERREARAHRRRAVQLHRLRLEELGAGRGAAPAMSPRSSRPAPTRRADRTARNTYEEQAGNLRDIARVNRWLGGIAACAVPCAS